MHITKHRVTGAEYVRNIYSATPEHGTPYENILVPEYWKHIASNFRPGDRIEVVSEDGAWFAELFVVSTGKQWVKVFPLRFVELSESAPDEQPAGTSSHNVEWRGPKRKWSVERNSDKEVIKDGFATKGEALGWLTQFQAEVG
jgi:hypothetical protein